MGREAVRWVSATRAGRKGHNQDRVWVSLDGCVAVVADGATASPHSEKASQCVVDVARALYRPGAGEGWLGDLFESVNCALLSRVAAGEDVGFTTLSAVHRQEEHRVLAVAVGDSPILHLGDGRVLEVVRPHRRYDSLIARGLVTPAEADTLFEGLPWWARLCLNVWLPHPRVSLKPSLRPVEVRAGDLLVLCTDGVTDAFPPPELATALGQLPDEAAVGRLLRAASQRSDDDLTCAVGVV